jgi:signal transduction histidine kinase
VSSATQPRGARDIRALASRLRERVAPGPPPSVEPSSEMFASIRLRLTLWYTGVLAAILIVAGALLFFGVQAVLLAPVNYGLQRFAEGYVRHWQSTGLPPDSCPSPSNGLPSVVLRPGLVFVACYDAHGRYIGGNPLASYTPEFRSPPLAQSALSSGSGAAIDTVRSSAFGEIRRYALVVHDASGHQMLGVIQVGVSIESDVQVLQILLRLLLLAAALTLVGSVIGGVLLSGRALEPARLSLARQQAFIADASHELRTPLTLVRAEAEVLLSERDRLDPEDASLLDDIVSETERMGALVENLLTLARLDNSAYHMEQDVVDLSQIASDTVHRVRTLAEARDVSVLAESTGETLVVGDATWLGEAALILVDNAVKYSRPAGTVNVRAYRDGQQAVLEVRDTGIGIPADSLPHLGERFYRVDKARSRQMGGAGLGLSIARSIAAEHHGTLVIESVGGKGTTARLCLPAVGGADTLDTQET